MQLISDFNNLGSKLGIFGGSFDPVHNGHVELVKLVKNKFNLSSVVFIPCNKNPLKPNTPIASNKDRLTMLSLALQHLEGMYISEIECNSANAVNYSIDTVKAILSQYKDGELFFILGADQIKQLHLWKDYQQLLNLAKIITIGRDGIDFDKTVNFNPVLSPDEQALIVSNYVTFNNETSATKIRQLFKTGKMDEVRKHISENVFDYICKNMIY